MTFDRDATGVILIDHGSRRAESNNQLVGAAALFREVWSWAIVEPAHMELEEPSLAEAFGRCVEQGAETVVIFPYFLSPGRHWHEDIPRLAAEAAAGHPGVNYLVTAPFGLHPLMLQIVDHRIERCLQQAVGLADACDFCEASKPCQLASVSDEGVR